MSKLDVKKEISAGGIVYRIGETGSREWLITQHSLHKGWGFPKGIVGDVIPNEPTAEAALREVQEEGGIVARIIDLEPVDVHYTYRLNETQLDKTVLYYLMEYISGNPDDHDWEVSAATFMSTEEIRNTLTFDSDKDAFESMLKNPMLK